MEDLLEAGEYLALKSWFNHWNNPDELCDKILLWGHLFLPHYLRDESPEFHRDLIKKIFSKKNEYTAAPRGFSKTTVIQLCIAFSCVNRIDKFIAVIEKTFTEAAEVIKGVHDEFIDNETLLLVYGNLISSWEKRKNFTSKVKNPDARGDIFINTVRIRGKGFNSTIRGLKSRQWRPTRIILDDVEEDEHISNPEQRVKYRKNYDKGIQPAVDITGSIKVFGTILHQDSLLNNLINNHGGKIYRAHDGDDPATASIKSFLWPQRWTRERLIKKRSDMQVDNRSSNAYAQEYLNKPTTEEERNFQFDWLWEMVAKPDKPKELYRAPKYRVTMAEFEMIRKKTTLNVYAMIDAADATTEQADWTGLVVIAVAPNGARFRIDVRREKRNINGVIQLIFEVWKKWIPYGLCMIGIEKKAYTDQILPLFKPECDRLMVYPVLEELRPMGRNKENRILGALQGLYEYGKMISVGNLDPNGYFVPAGDTDKLLTELYDHPNAKNDDLSDAEAYQGDIAVIPLNEKKNAMPHHIPQDDPWENDLPEQETGAGSFQGRFDDPDAY